MTELWIPQPNKQPDVTNIYDMMLVFQEQIDKEIGKYAKIQQATFALRALSMCLKQLPDEERQISVVTHLAVIDSTEEEGKGAIAEHVGLRGMIEDVHCINIGQRVPMSVSLGIDVISMFPPDSPDDDDLILSTAKAPISSVRYIETLAS